MTRSLCLTLLTLLACSAAFAEDATIQADKSSVSSACSAEAATAGCGNETVGHGLLKCIHAYKKANRATFKISPGCKAAMKQLRSDVQNKK